MQCISDALKRASFRDRFKLEMRPAASPQEILRANLSLKPAIVHFCGHGSAEPGQEGLILEDRNGEKRIIGTDAIDQFFKNFAGHVRCVVLNACYSEKQAAAIARHIDFVVGMKGNVSDQAALAFTEAFYDALGAGSDFHQAFAVAQNAIQMAGLGEHHIPSMHARPGAEAALFCEQEAGLASTPVDRNGSTLKLAKYLALWVLLAGLAGTTYSMWRHQQVQALNSRAMAHFEQQRPEEARESWQRSLELDPTFTEAVTNLAVLESAEGNVRAARLYFRRAVQLEPSVALHQFNLGHFLLERGSLDESLDALNRAVELDPDYAEAFNELGRANLQMARWSDAGTAFEKGLDVKRPIEPATSATLHKNLAKAFLGLEDPKAALSHLSQEVLSTLEHDESIREALVLRARAFAALGRTTDACRELAEFESRNGGFSQLGPPATELGNKLGCPSRPAPETPSYSQGDPP